MEKEDLAGGAGGSYDQSKMSRSSRISRALKSGQNQEASKGILIEGTLDND